MVDILVELPAATDVNEGHVTAVGWGDATAIKAELRERSRQKWLALPLGRRLELTLEMVDRRPDPAIDGDAA